MAWHRRSKCFFETFRSFSSKIVPKNHFHEPIPSIKCHFPSTAALIKPRIPGFSPAPPPISFKLGFRYGPQSYSNAPFSSIGRRCYYVDRYQVRHFKPRGFRRWLGNPRAVLALVVVGTGLVITVYYGNLETVPYTGRKHFVILPVNVEQQLGEAQFQKIKNTFQGKILPAIHPESIRIRLIAKNIIDALQRGLKKEEMYTDMSYASLNDRFREVGGQETMAALMDSPEGKSGWRKEDEVLDDSWVDQTRMKAKEKGSKSATRHLENLNWEILVVDEPVVNAFCLPGGKIVVFTGLLEHFRTNPDIATIVGHEVSHAVARHQAEQITKNLWFAIIQLILYQFFMPDVVNAMSTLLLRLPFSRRMEIEADYIGVLLMASAGYDPRVAPLVFEKLGKVTGDSKMRDYLSTHPSGKTRAKLLSQAKVMEEALSIYRETVAGRAVEGFIL